MRPPKTANTTPDSATAQSSEGVSQQPPKPEPVSPVRVLYCPVCTFPLEYCEFSSSFTRCKEWVKEAHPDLYDRYYSEDAVQAKLGTLSLEAQAKLEQDTAKKEAKAEAKADAALKKKMASQVTISRIERNKRKSVTSISGLEAFGIDLKKASKQFSSKFATGSSVTKNALNQDEIIVQGDVSDDIVEMISGSVGVLKGIPTENVEVVTVRKKKE